MSNNFESLKTTKKGNVAEDIVQQKLLDKGYFIYKSVTNKSHHFDFLIHDKKGNVFALEIKCKELRNKYPDTGFPLTSWKKYMAINKKIKFMILWIDYKKEEIYGNELDELIKPVIIDERQYPKLETHSIIYFSYNQMKVYCKLNEEEVLKIKEISALDTEKQ